LEIQSHSSGTLYEYPIIVDIDGDGSAEIIAAANDYSSHNDTHGIVVIGDEFNSWNAGLPVWNQHAFSITNIESNGSIPPAPLPNWYEYNNFRSGDLQARFGNNQADLYAHIVLVCRDECNENRIIFSVVVGNNGTLDIEDSIVMEIWGVRADDSRTILDVILVPGVAAGEQSEGIEVSITLPTNDELVDIVVIVDSASLIEECNEENNESFWGGALCP
jgi:hypothetical protein